MEEGTVADVNGAGKIEVVEIDQLHVDRAYQRELNMELVQKIASKWEPTAAGPIVVSRRRNGDLYIVNGQHRTAGAKMAGETHILAQVVDGLDEATEAVLRLQGNTRLGDRSLERFRAQVAAGYAESLDIVKILARFDTKINTASNEPGINCVSAVERIYRTDKGVLLVRTLEVVKEAFGEIAGRSATAALLAAIAWFLQTHPAEEYDRNRLIEKLSGVGLAALDRMATNTKAAMGGAKWVNVYRAIVEAYNEKLSESNRLEWRTRGASRAFAKASEFNVSAESGLEGSVSPSGKSI
jgi:hypothetical protein